MTEEVQARRFVVRGRVQGVGFRWFVEREAHIVAYDCPCHQGRVLKHKTDAGLAFGPMQSACAWRQKLGDDAQAGGFAAAGGPITLPATGAFL